jgi:hypothetical protein
MEHWRQTDVYRGRWSRQNLLEAGRTVGASECVASRWSIRGGGMYQRWRNASEAVEFIRGGGIHQRRWNSSEAVEFIRGTWR